MDLGQGPWIYILDACCSGMLLHVGTTTPLGCGRGQAPRHLPASLSQAAHCTLQAAAPLSLAEEDTDLEEDKCENKVARVSEARALTDQLAAGELGAQAGESLASQRLDGSGKHWE